MIFRTWYDDPGISLINRNILVIASASPRGVVTNRGRTISSLRAQRGNLMTLYSVVWRLPRCVYALPVGTRNDDTSELFKLNHQILDKQEWLKRY